MSEEENSVLEWVKAFGKVAPEEVSSYKALSYCFAFYKILNFASDGEIKTDSLAQPKKEDDWITAMKNIKAFDSAMQKEFNSKNVKYTVEATAMARGSKPEVLMNFYKSIITYCYQTAHKPEFEAQTAKCSEKTQQFVKQIIASYETKESSKQQETAAAPVSAAPASKAPEKESAQARELTVAEKAQIRVIERKNAEYKAELEKLQKELHDIQTQNATATASSNAGESDAQASAQKLKIQQMEKESKDIDEELKKLQDATTEKENEQQELKKAQEKLQTLEEQLRKPLDFEALKQNEDPQIQDLLNQIKKAEEQLKPEYTDKLSQDVKKMADTINKLKEVVASKKAKAGDAKDEPENGETAKLEQEIEEIVNRNNQLNREIMGILSRTEAIEQSKNSHSFLEHLRTSDLFLSMH